MKKKGILSEIIGIILGDGYIRYNTAKYRYNINISLNGVDNYDYYQYVKKLLREFFQIEISEYWYKDSKNAQGDEKGVTLSIFNKEIVKMLLEEGLLAGDKVKSGVCVPDWIKSKEFYILRCLKGLVDTDGYIGVVKTKNSKFPKITITFTNRSKKLVKDFKQLSELVNIRCSNVHGPYETFDSRTKKKYKLYSVSITAKDQVQMFIKKINPKKWDYGKEIIGLLLILYKNPMIYKNIRKELMVKFGRLNFYNKDQQEFLRNQLQSKIININTEDIEEAINMAFIYEKIHYTNQFAEELKEKLIKLGSLREIEEYYNSKEGGLLKVYRKSIIQYLEKLFTQESKYKNLYGGLNGFRIWKSYNFDILIKKQNGKLLIYRFPFFIKKKLCNRINQIMRSDIDNDLVYSKLKSVIESEDLNGNIITNINSFFIKKFERLAFLLNDPSSKSAIKSNIIILIKIVNEFNDLLKKGIKKKIGELSYYLNEKFNVNWKSENLKKILIELNLLEKLITDDDINKIVITSPSISKNEGGKSLKDDKKITNNEKNTVSNSYSSKPFSYNKPLKESLNDEDFTDPYLWFSPQVRKAIQSKAESLIDQVHEDVSAREDFSDPWEDISNYAGTDLDTSTAEVLIDNPDVDVIPEQEIEPNPEVPEIQEDKETDDININAPDEEIEDLINEQQGLIEDQINDLEQIKDPEIREVDLRPDDFDPIIEPVYDPISQPVTEIIPPPDPPSIPDNVISQQQKNDPETQDSPQNQQEQEEDSQVPEKSQDEVGTEQSIEEISESTIPQDVEPIINESIEQDQIPELNESEPENLSDKTDVDQEDPENTNQDESKDLPDLDEKDEDIDNDKEDKKGIGGEEEDDKDEKKEEGDKDKIDDGTNKEKEDEKEEKSKENEEESDNEPQEENYDDMDDIDEEPEHGFTPEDVYEIMRELYERMQPQIYSYQSSNLGPYPINEIDFTDNFSEKDNLPGINDCIDNFGGERDEKIPIDGFDELSEIDGKQDNIDYLT